MPVPLIDHLTIDTGTKTCNILDMSLYQWAWWQLQALTLQKEAAALYWAQREHYAMHLEWWKRADNYLPENVLKFGSKETLYTHSFRRILSCLDVLVSCILVLNTCTNLMQLLLFNVFYPGTNDNLLRSSKSIQEVTNTAALHRLAWKTSNGIPQQSWMMRRKN